MPLTLPQRYIDGMVQHARDEAPDECCGIIAGKGGAAGKLYRMTNVQHSPFRYEMDGKEVLALLRELDARDEEFVVIYHSHLKTQAYPSPTDVRIAAGWPDPHYVLVSLMDAEPSVRAFRIEDGAITEDEIVVGDEL